MVYNPTNILAWPSIPHLANTGVIQIVDTGAFTFQNANEIRCNKSGNLIILGSVNVTGGKLTKFTILKNGVNAGGTISYTKVIATISVNSGDVIKIGYQESENYIVLAALTLIL